MELVRCNAFEKMKGPAWTSASTQSLYQQSAFKLLTRRGPTNSRAVMLVLSGSDLASVSWPSCILQVFMHPSEEPLTAILPLLMSAVTGAAVANTVWDEHDEAATGAIEVHGTYLLTCIIS
jgi:hypothetical protein